MKTKQWKRGKIDVQLSLRESNDLVELLNYLRMDERRLGDVAFKRARKMVSKRVLNKLVKAQNWYFGYPFHQ